MYSDFDTSEPPFSLLADDERARAVRGMDILFIPAGTRVIEAGKVSSHLYVVDKGLIEERQPKARGGDSAVSHYRDGEVFGSLALLRGRSRNTYVAAEDTLCLTLMLNSRAEAFPAYHAANGGCEGANDPGCHL